MRTDWERADARYWLLRSEARKEALAFDNEKLLFAATLRAAEFRASRKFTQGAIEDHIFNVSIAADAQLAGWRRGRQLGIISLIY